jgi:hypothetical protein
MTCVFIFKYTLKKNEKICTAKKKSQYCRQKTKPYIFFYVRQALAYVASQKR